MKYFQMRKVAHLRKDLKEGSLRMQPCCTSLSVLITYMKKFLDCDWLREM